MIVRLGNEYYDSVTGELYEAKIDYVFAQYRKHKAKSLKKQKRIFLQAIEELDNAKEAA